MAVPRIPVAALMLGLCAAACGQDPVPLNVPPAARLAPVPGPVGTFADSAPVLPPLLPVPAPVVVPRKSCLPCQTEYIPNHAYLPEANPDCGTGGCDGECNACRRWWVNGSFLLACSQDLGVVHRKLECGLTAGAGYWLNDAKTLALEINVLNVNDPHHQTYFQSIINSPVTVTTGDIAARMELFTYNRYRIDGLVGYQFSQLHENFFLSAANGLALDQNTRNRIQAAELGLVGTYKFGPYFCEVLGKVGFGRNSETITINGVRGTDSVMSLVPEFGARVGYQLGEGVFGTLGYNFLYMSNVARPGRGDADFYLHGITVGMECRF